MAFLEMEKNKMLFLKKLWQELKRRMGSFMKPLKKWDQQTKIVPPNVKWLNYIKYLPWFKCKIWIKLIPTNTEFETAPHHQHGIPWCTSSKDFKIILIQVCKFFIFFWFAMHTQTWVVQLFTCHIKTQWCSRKNCG